MNAIDDIREIRGRLGLVIEQLVKMESELETLDKRLVRFARWEQMGPAERELASSDNPPPWVAGV